jgi:large subunit ribosomal protein L22
MKHLNTKDNEAYAVLKNMRVSPSKANIVLEMIRGKKASEALNILKFSPRSIAKDIGKVLNSAISNAENNHQLDIDILKVSEAYCGKGMVMKRWRPRAKGRPGRINKFFTNVTIKVAEVQEKVAEVQEEGNLKEK